MYTVELHSSLSEKFMLITLCDMESVVQRVVTRTADEQRTTANVLLFWT
jgi:hypothetical protein